MPLPYPAAAQPCRHPCSPLLRSLNHPHIVNVSEVVVGPSLDSVFMVMEYADHDLKAGGLSGWVGGCVGGWVSPP